VASGSQSRFRRWTQHSADFLTVIVAILALVVGIKTFVIPDERPGLPDAAQIETSALGRVVDSLEVVSPTDSEPQYLRFGGSHQLVLLFRSDCPACQATRPVWETLVATLNVAIPVHAITAEPGGLGNGFLEHSRVRVWHAVSPEQVSRAFAIPVVPVTLLIAPDGSVAWVKVGRPQPEDVGSINALIAG
jgi:hypothetical protein